MRKDDRCTAILGKIVVILVLIPHPLSLGKTFYMIPFDSDCDTSSPPAILQSGTAGSSVVYANGTSAGSTGILIQPQWLQRRDRDIRHWLNPFERLGGGL